MNYDELAVVCEQLAGMLRAGVTLPEALRQTVAMLSYRKLRRQLEVLADRLGEGVSVSDSVRDCQLPGLFRQMLVIGAATDDLPGALESAAAHFRRVHELRSRFVSLMIYPSFIMVALLVLSLGIGGWTAMMAPQFEEILGSMLDGGQLPLLTVYAMKWAPWHWVSIMALMVAMGTVMLLVLFVPRIQHAVLWRLPGLRHASIAQLASSVSMLLARGVAVDQALLTISGIESEPMRRELKNWIDRLRAGNGRFAAWTAGSRLVPPMFVALVEGYGDDLAGGFQAAADVYQGIARQRASMLLHAGMPLISLMFIMVALLQAIIFVVGLMLPLIELLNKLGG